MDDVGLVERSRKGDEAAFAALFERHKSAVYRYAVHMRAHDAAAADDVVQEVFLAFARQLKQFDPRRGNVLAYLLGITRRQVFKDLERTRMDEPLDATDVDTRLPAPETDPLAGLTRAEIVRRVRKAIAALPAVYREAIVLCEMNGLDYAETAAVMACPIGTVRSRLHRARGLLKKALADLREGAATVHG